MKKNLTILLLLASCTGMAQKVEKYYDYLWKEAEPKYARFYSIMEKTDSGWHRRDYFLHKMTLQMDGRYEDSACEISSGRFVFLYPDKKIESYGRYVHDKKEGLWLTYHYNGMMADSTVYKDGEPAGTTMGWHVNGVIADSAVYKPDSSGIEITWFDNGNPSSAGLFSGGFRKNGKWKYFHKTGGMSAIEMYDHGKLTDKQYFDEKGGAISDTTNKDTGAEFPGGNKAWGKYLGKEIFFPPQYELVNSDKAVVVISFTIDEDGKVQDAYVSTPFYPEFDKIALNAVRHSPNWLPARSHNRRISHEMRQPVTFSQVED